MKTIKEIKLLQTINLQLTWIGTLMLALCERFTNDEQKKFILEQQEIILKELKKL